MKFLITAAILSTVLFTGTASAEEMTAEQNMAEQRKQHIIVMQSWTPYVNKGETAEK